MEQLLNYFKNNKYYNQILKVNNKLHPNSDEALSFLLYLSFIKENKPMVVVLENLLACNNLFNKLKKYLSDKVYLYCADEISKYSTIASSPEFTFQRLFVLDKLSSSKPIIVLTHPMAIDRLIPSKLNFSKSYINIVKNNEYDIASFKEKLIKLGYKNSFKVSQPFEFSTRGSVIDIYSINYKDPIRIDFFDTLVDRITFFDVESQRSIEEVNEVNIIPASEFIINDLEKGINKIRDFAKVQIAKSDKNIDLSNKVDEDIDKISSYQFGEELYHYFPFFDTYGNFNEYCKDCKVYVVNEESIKKSEAFLLDEIATDEIAFFEKGESLGFYKLFETYDDFKKELSDIKYVSLDIANEVSDVSILPLGPYDFNFEFLYKELVEKSLEHYCIYVGFDSQIHYDTFVKFLEQKQMNYREIDDINNIKEGINLSHVDLSLGIDFKDIKLAIIGENEVFAKKIKTSISQFSRYKNSVSINSVNEIEVGDYLVHEHYGIGIYQGLETMLNNNVHRDYLKICYKDGDVLYVPLEQYKLVRKYVSKEGAKPKINKLGSKEWDKTKARIKERVNDIAEKLVNLYSLRSQKTGFAFEKDDDLQLAFENDFPYELTIDQAKCLKDIKNDMESNYIMDRLLVGDVGFGKTEIALRAAFKAINSGKQVALLCPTTLLARQHYLTSLNRFRNFGIRIKLLSRLVKGKEESETIKDLQSGDVDLVIGTHRLLSEDVSFKNLGLLIVDEEHKFGVIHKEKIKEIKQNVDVLTLSATPIPRTLQMALTGIRGCSTINTPIDNRMPVQTYVIRKEKQAVKEIIERELARGGQVYYLCNQIERLPNIAHEIQTLVKNAKVAIAHGKLSTDQVEDIMAKFIDNEYNILLCTTIIENGIDIPNVNTILVDNADHFGMAQLYQIKGRVGRSDRLAYAYLMYSTNKELSDVASKRLQAIKEFTSLGSGYKIAMRDLITRGAGDILGEEQSGFIETVGIDMFIEMLQQAILKKKEGISEEIIKKPIAHKVLNIDAYIPENYFNNDFEKIDLYKEIEKVDSFEKLDELKTIICDQTGRIPESMKLLLDKKAFDLYVDSKVIDSYDEFDKYVLIKLNKDFNNYRGVGMSLFDNACKVSRDITLRFRNNIIECEIKKSDKWLEIALEYFNIVKQIKDEFCKEK